MTNNIDKTFLERQMELLKAAHDSLSEEGHTGGKPPGGGGGDLEKRLEKLENALPEIKEKLIKMEAKIDSIDKHSASKADLATIESTLIKWFVATAFAMTALASGITFGIARMISH